MGVVEMDFGPGHFNTSILKTESTTLKLKPKTATKALSLEGRQERFLNLKPKPCLSLYLRAFVAVFCLDLCRCYYVRAQLHIPRTCPLKGRHEMILYRLIPVLIAQGIYYRERYLIRGACGRAAGQCGR